MTIPTCPHCRFGMWEPERVRQADRPYGRFACGTQWRPTCTGRSTETSGQLIRWSK